MVKRVAVIGAGSAGLAALRRFAVDNEGDKYDVICFEQLSDVGGMWIYSDVINDVTHLTGSQYTAVYKNLRSNHPKQIMAFSDFPFPDHLPSYVHHTGILKYLQDYCEHFKLKKYIKFSTKVTQVIPRDVIGRGNVWDVSVQNLLTNQRNEYVFDVIIVCVGHFSVPIYPKIKGLNLFQGELLHAQTYRNPEDYKGKRVLIIGGSFSGVDIASEICEFSEKIWLSHRKPKHLPLLEKIEQIGEIESICKREATLYPKPNSLIEKINYETDSQVSNIKQTSLPVLETKSEESGAVEKIDPNNGESIDNIDVIICCTGYISSYPFLSADCGVTVFSPSAVGPLYKGFISISRPSLAFLGLPPLIVSLPLTEHQLKFFKAHLEGRVIFSNIENRPSAADWTEEELKTALCLDILENPNVFEKFVAGPYLAELASLGGFEPVAPYFNALLKEVLMQMDLNIPGYRDKEYRVIDDSNFEVVPTNY